VQICIKTLIKTTFLGPKEIKGINKRGRKTHPGEVFSHFAPEKIKF